MDEFKVALWIVGIIFAAPFALILFFHVMYYVIIAIPVCVAVVLPLFMMAQYQTTEATIFGLVWIAIGLWVCKHIYRGMEPPII
jgi:hypothetical protein